MKRLLLLFFCLSLVGNFASVYSQEKLVDFDRIYPEELNFSGFELANKTTLKIEASGFYDSARRREVRVGNGWILNAETRDVVWELYSDGLEKKDDFRGEIVEVSKEVALPAGKYEAYYSSFVSLFREGSVDHFDEWDNYEWRGFGDLYRRVRHSRWRDSDRYDRYYRDFYFKIEGAGKKVKNSDLEKLQKKVSESAVIVFDVKRDDRRETKAFTLSKPTQLEVYAVGEARGDGNFDYGVILDANSWERVWELGFDNSEHAGGAGKNRVIAQDIKLDAGSYIAMYVTDDSHSPIEWNSAPPFDPAFWGMTISLVNASDKNSMQLSEEPPFQLKNAIVDFTRVRDDEFRSKGFSLKKAMDVRIVATGEGDDGDMFDFGWIVDAKTRRRVWGMDYHDTDPGGGASKNRMIDELNKNLKLIAKKN